MTETWWHELLQFVIHLLTHPLLYWSFIFIFLTGYFRMKRERINFGVKIFPIFSESKHTWKLSILFGIILSIIFLAIGFVFTYEFILLLAIVTIILTLTFRTSLLSPSYTIGLSLICVALAPSLLKYQSYLAVDVFSDVYFSMVAIVLGLFLALEAFFVSRVTRNEVFPTLVKSERGVWIGQHQLKKATVIPFFALIPGGGIIPFAEYWPHFSLGAETYTFVIIPFLLGFNFTVRNGAIEKSANRIGRHISLLSLLVILIAIASLWESRLGLIAAVIAILGREIIAYKFKQYDKAEVASFNKLDDGLKVLAIIEGTPADKLGILVGETITKVNDIELSHANDFYKELRSSGAAFKLEVIDDNGEIRFIKHARFEHNHHSLGIIFTDQPRRLHLKESKSHS